MKIFFFRYKAAISFTGLLIVTMLMVIGYRFLQRHINLELKEKDLWEVSSQVIIDPYDTHHTAFFERFLSVKNWNNLLREPPTENLSDREITDRLRLFNYYSLYASEKRYLNYLRENSLDIKYRGLLKWYLYYLELEFTQLFESKKYEKARYRAQTYLNYANSIPIDNYFNDASLSLSRARNIVEYRDNNFPYSDEHVPDLIQYGYLSDSDELKNNVNSWEAFIANYPSSSKLDEAEFNIINIALDNLKSDEDKLNTYRLLRKFMSKYKKSYLADDAGWHAIQLAGELGYNESMLKIFRVIATRYNKTDHYKRLKFNLIKWLEQEHKVPNDLSIQVVGFLFASVRYSDELVENILVAQFPSDIERKKIVNILSFIRRQYSKNSKDEFNLNNLTINQAVISTMSLWIDNKERNYYGAN